MEVFCEVAAPYPSGSELELLDGRSGVVTAVTQQGPLARVAGADIARAEAG